MVINVTGYMQEVYGWDTKCEAIWTNLTHEANELHNAFHSLENDISEVVIACTFGLRHTLSEQKDQKTGHFKLAIAEGKQEIKNVEVLRAKLLELKKSGEFLVRVTEDMLKKEEFEMRLSKSIEKSNFIEEGIWHK